MFDEIPLDDVVISSDTLIRITDLGAAGINRLGNNRRDCEDYCLFVSKYYAPLQDKQAQQTAVRTIKEKLADGKVKAALQTANALSAEKSKHSAEFRD